MPPIEIYEEIFSYLLDDKDTLSACSLACRQLTGPSQKLLFSRIILRAPPKIRSYQPSHVYPLGGTLSNFKALLNGSPHIADYVECLQIIDICIPFLYDSAESEGGDDGSVEGSDEDFSEPYGTWLSKEKSLPIVLRLLRKLKALVIDFVADWGHLSDKVLDGILHLLQLPSLVYIDLTSFPLAVLTQAISNNLRHLCIGSSSLTKHIRSFIPDCTTVTPIYLESLSIGDLETAYSCLSKSRVNLSRLRKLEVNVGGADNHALTWALLQSCKDTLEHLQITPHQEIRRDPADPYVNQYQEPIDMSQLALLKIFAVELTCYDSEPQGIYIDSIWWLVKFLRFGSSFQELQELTIRVDFFLKKKVNIESWKDVSDILLVTDRFPSLKTLNIWITYSRDGKEIPAGIAKELNVAEYIEKLRSPRGLQVNVILCPMLKVPYPFAPNPRWENIYFSNMSYEEETDC